MAPPRRSERSASSNRAWISGSAPGSWLQEEGTWQACMRLVAALSATKSCQSFTAIFSELHSCLRWDADKAASPDLPEDANAHTLQCACVEELGVVGRQGHLRNVWICAAGDQGGSRRKVPQGLKC